MPANEIKTIISALDQSSPEFQKATQNVRDYQKTTEGAKGGVEQLSHTHLSARHALALVASQTGMNTSELMHLYYAIEMIPGPYGVALGAVMAFKSGLESLREAEEANIKKQQELAENLNKYREYTIAATPKGAAGEGANLVKQANDEIRKMLDERANLEGTWINQLGVVPEEKVNKLPPILKQVVEEINFFAQANKDAQKTLTDSIASTEMMRDKTAERYVLEKLVLDTMVKQADAYYKIRESMEVTNNAAADKRKEQDAEIENAQKIANIEKQAMVGIINRETKKATAAGQSVSLGAVEQLPDYIEHNEAFKKAQLDADKIRKEQYREDLSAAREHSKRMIELQSPHQVIDSYDRKAKLNKEYTVRQYNENAELAEKLRVVDESVSLSKEQKDKESAALRSKYRAQADQESLDHNKALKSLRDEEKVFRLTADAEMLRLKGDTYGAEKKHLEVWLEQEKQAHIGQAAALKRIDEERAAKAAEIERKHQEQKADTMEKYNLEIIRAQKGGGMESFEKLKYDREKEIKELRREGRNEEANLAEQSEGETIKRMGIEAQRSLMGKKQVGFTDITSGWASFASSMNTNPDEREKRQQTRDLIEAIRGWQRTIQQGGFVGALAP
jgi:hypothetical protein